MFYTTMSIELSFFLGYHAQMQFLQLLLFNWRGRIHQEIGGALRLGEGNHLADTVFICQQHHQAVNMSLVHTREWVVFRLMALPIFIEMQKREINHPAESHLVGVNQIEALGQLSTQSIEDIVTDLGAIRNKKQQVTWFSLETVNDRLHFVMRHEFYQR